MLVCLCLCSLPDLSLKPFKFKFHIFHTSADGYDVDYLRIPVTDEKAPKDQDFEELIDRLWNVPPDAALIFNCQVAGVWGREGESYNLQLPGGMGEGGGGSG